MACVVLATSIAESAIFAAEPVNVPPPPPPLMTTDFVRVTAPWIAIPIENHPTTGEVGKHVMLIQENEEFFITMCSNQYEGVFLAAFPVTTREGRPAWTTPEQKVFFAYRTPSCRGNLYFRQGDELPVDAETRSSYKLRLERFDQAFPLYLSKTNAGFEYAKAPPPPPPTLLATAKASQKPATPVQKTSVVAPQKASVAAPPRLPPVKRYIVTPVGPSTNVFMISMLEQNPSTEPGGKGDNKGDGFFNRIFSRNDKADTATKKSKEPDAAKAVSPLDTAATKTQSVQEVAAATGVSTNAAATGSLSTNARSAAAKTEASTTGLAPKYKHQTPIIVAVALVLFMIGLFWELQRKAHQRELAMEAAAKALEAAANGSGQPPPLPDSPNDFSGSIASMSLGSVTQFLNSDKETGTLYVKDKTNVELGTLVFIKGEIVDAKSPKKRGIDALYEILRNKEGFFSFLREEPKDVEKTITLGTISVLLDAHRIMDEELKPPAPVPPPVQKPAPAEKASRQTAPKKPVTKLKLHDSH